MNQRKGLPATSRTVVLAVLVLGVVLTGCGEDGSSTPTITNSKVKKKPAEQDASSASNPDDVARAYARRISGGKYEYGGLGAAAYSGCLEALLEEHVGPTDRSYKDEFPESNLQTVYEKALKDCASGERG